MATYKTAEIAAMIGIHPSTVRLYESRERKSLALPFLLAFLHIFKPQFLCQIFITAAVHI